MTEEKKVAIIGGGIAGIEAAIRLTDLGHHVVLIEKEAETGGHLKKWHKLFPYFREASDILALRKKLASRPGLELITGTRAESVRRVDGHYEVGLAGNRRRTADAVLLATGFSTFHAERKEEYGYGIYKNVITSVDLEALFNNPDAVTDLVARKPQRIAFIHCVGSRDVKTGNTYCSRVCCVTAVKQAIELKKLLPATEIFCFYMDLRMFGQNYEELYASAQEDNKVQFIRGRLSEASENIDKSLQIKAEDTLSGRPIRMSVDLMVLMVGMELSDDSKELASQTGLKLGRDGFISSVDFHLRNNVTHQPGLFIAGSCGGPRNLNDCRSDACCAAFEIDTYLRNLN
ncbi:MAG: FAD-dependent oxidoreductase [Bacteroidota bacterium]